MKKAHLYVVSGLMLCALCATAQANPLPQELKRDRHEIRSDKRELSKDEAALKDDHRDLGRLSDLVIKWDELRKSNAPAGEIDAIEKLIAAEVRKDLRENKVQTEAAKKEVVESEKELRKSRREARRERKDGDMNKAERKDDVRDRRDDKRDLKNDIKDAEAAQALLAKKEATAGELFVLQKKIDAAGDRIDDQLRNQQRVLLERYLQLSQEEIRMGLREKHEDRRELKEDRRELREDRRE
jgi:hypothetical protein